MPREPTRATLGCSQGPMTEMFTLPAWSIWAGLIQMRNRSVKIASKMSSIVSGIARWLSVRNCPRERVGMGIASLPDSGVERTARSGACVFFARCAASAPSVVTDVTMTSPRSSRAMQAMINSSMLYSGMIHSFRLHSQPLPQRPLAAKRPQVVLIAREPVALEVLVPGRAVAGTAQVLLDVREVRPVVGGAPREMGAPRGLDHPGDERAQDPDVVPVGLQPLRQQDLLRREERPARRLGPPPAPRAG